MSPRINLSGLRCAACGRAGFTGMPNWMRGRFTAQEMALIWCVESYPPTEHPSVRQLARDIGVSVAGVHRIMRTLERDQILLRRPRFDEFGAQLANGYESTIYSKAAEASTRGRAA